MHYEQPVFRPPSEADSLIVQATIGCSWNHCTYCAMYRQKTFRVRPIEEVLEEIRRIPAVERETVRRVFVADGDALALPAAYWQKLLTSFQTLLPKTLRVSAYATARNLLQKSVAELRSLRTGGLRLLYIGPESGHDATLKAIAKGASFDDHVMAAERARQAEIAQSLIFLLGAAGVENSQAHASASASLITAMDPRYVSLLTLTLIEGTPMHTQLKSRRFALPPVGELLLEARTIVDETRPTNAVFRCNHASNYLPLAGRLPRDRERLLGWFDQAVAGNLPLRPEWARGL